MSDPDPFDPAAEPSAAAPPRDPEDAQTAGPKDSDTRLDAESLRAAREFMFTGRSPRSSSPVDEVAKRIEALREAQARRSFEVAAVVAPETEVEPAVAAAPPPIVEIQLSATGVRRAGSGWRASCRHPRGVDARYVSDTRYGGYVGSFLQAIEVRDRFYRERGLPIPPEATAVLDGRVIATEIERVGDRLVVRWQGEEHEVEGEDAEEVATEIALDLFVELVSSLPGAPLARR